MENQNHIEYLLSVHILKELKEMNLISEKELDAIDQLNKKSFQMTENQGFNLIS